MFGFVFACVSGLYTSGVYACNPGEYLEDGQCVQCPAGSYCDGTNAPQPCTGNTFSESGAYECLLCIDTEIPNVEHTQCTACDGAKEYVVGGVCDVCGVGSYVNEEHTQCLTCPIGYYCNGNGTAIECPVGSYSGTTGATVCVACADGETTSGAGATSCDVCVTGYCTYTDAINGKSCKKCRAGYYCPELTSDENNPNAELQCDVNGNPGDAYKCPKGFYSTSGASVCIACPTGWTTDVPGATSGRQCKVAPVKLLLNDNSEFSLPLCLDDNGINKKVVKNKTTNAN